MLLLLFPLLACAADFATVVRVHGHATSGSVALTEKAKLAEGATVVTGDDGFVQLALDDGSSVHVARSSTLELRRSATTHVPLLALVAGKLRALVKKAAGAEKLLVTTKTAVLGIRGTDFTVSYDPETKVTSLVTVEGSVAMVALADGVKPEEAIGGGAPVMVAAGTFSFVGRSPPSGDGRTPGTPGVPGGSDIATGKSAVLSEGLAQTAGAAAVPAPPKKVPSFFLENAKKEEDSFLTVDPQGNVMMQHAPK